MSFSTESKRELIKMNVKSGCCRRSLFYGMMMGASVSEHNVIVSFDISESAEFVYDYAKDVLYSTPDLVRRVTCGRERFFVTFQSKQVLSFVNKLDFGDKSLTELLTPKCGGCIQNFLKGVFLAIGTVNDPKKSFHAELKLSETDRAEKLDAFLAERGIPARLIDRDGKIGLYYKSSYDIEELFSEMGANNILFEVINTKIEKEIRNNENRATNCVATNISKTVAATARQIEAIEKLKARLVFDFLPDDLKISAELRLANPDISLSELANMHIPAISKSGLTHRMNKLLAEAEKIK